MGRARRIGVARRILWPSLWLCTAISQSGCGSVLSGAGPAAHHIVAQAEAGSGVGSGYTLVSLSAETIGRYMRMPNAAPSQRVSPTAVGEVRLIPGDVLTVTISDSAAEGGLFAPLSQGGTVFDRVRVDAQGRISLPYVGRPPVAGLTLFQVEHAIRERVRRLASDPQVRVQLEGDLSGSVLVAGAVHAPGRFSTLQGPLTLLDAINMAGGVTLEPHLTTVVLRTGDAAHSFSYSALLAGENQPVPARSEIIVERARKRFVAMGAVGRPGLMDLPSDNPSLLEALGAVGWLNERTADPRGVFVFRLEAGQDEKPRATVFRLDMRNPAAFFLARQFQIMPEDAVYVTHASTHEFQKLIAPIVQVMVLGQNLNGF
ncbi:sugar transporter [Allopusillimonas ginsengisoli]|nr:sugar transporter [Allopusillimonas ginsengisoli]